MRYCTALRNAQVIIIYIYVCSFFTPGYVELPPNAKLPQHGDIWLVGKLLRCYIYDTLAQEVVLFQHTDRIYWQTYTNTTSNARLWRLEVSSHLQRIQFQSLLITFDHYIVRLHFISGHSDFDQPFILNSDPSDQRISYHHRFQSAGCLNQRGSYTCAEGVAPVWFFPFLYIYIYINILL